MIHRSKARACLLAALMLISLTTACASEPPSEPNPLLDSVREALKPGEIAYISVQAGTVSAADLRSAAQLTQKEGGKVLIGFDTVRDDELVGRITANPNLVPEDAEEYDFSLDLYSDAVVSVQIEAERKLEKPVMVIGTGQPQFGMYVVIAAKPGLDFTDAEQLIAYSLDPDGGDWTLLEDADCSLDDNGFVQLQTQSGGYLLITPAN